ncbi:peptidase S24 (plasmid) [Sphingomonas changnyeongensis]|uniref:Peptidase S24 n=1 Tax=Sphingomonas changnyeongensis TaxID=2698679 RepID=A0A7Z2S6E6_9SPHN|nr:helix-turn-helix transcriptional regulator [Sphingomonas changnyeongensis]QHL92055.1 peptidase S24 [Sphingomonas changnyeongensis]
MSTADPRAALDRLIKERGEDYAGLSRLLGRNPAYIQQYIKRGVPQKLDGDDRLTLARYFGVSEALLGGSDEQLPIARSMPGTGLVPIKRLDVGASAGAGASVDGEHGLHPVSFDARWLRQLVATRIDQLSMIRVQGDSMSPTLSDGDEIMVNQADAADRLRDGIYVLRLDDALMVKRLALHPVSREVAIRSDNPAYPSWPNCKLSQLAIIGRVVWAGRQFR